MRRSTAAEFLADPIGRYVVGRTWLTFSARDIAGGLLCGTLTASDMREALPLARAAYAPERRHVVFMDGSRVLALEEGAFAAVAAHIAANYDELHGKVIKLAAVRGPGLPGAAAEGFFRTIRAPYPVQVFSERDAALAWLGMTHAGPMLEELSAALYGEERVVDQLGPLLELNLRAWSIHDAAKALGVSVRTLQRRLRTEDTSFQEQLDLARVRVAQRLMRQPDISLGLVAVEVGCSSASSFTVMFRKAVGMTPGEWRAVRGRRA